MRGVRWALVLTILALFSAPSLSCSQELSGIRPLRPSLEDALRELPSDTQLLLEPAHIEAFLTELEGAPPDWVVLYGGGHHDPGHDERLFALNRDRDAKRTGNEVLSRRLAFVWQGELSAFEAEEQGFPVVLGPKMNKTVWGVVRFKDEDLPGRLVATTTEQVNIIKERLAGGKPVELDVVLAGRLIPEESVIYDFSHEEEGLGLIMPVVRIEALEFALRDSSHP